MPVSLAQIVQSSREALSHRQQRRPLREIRAALRDFPPTRGFARALARRAPRLAVIAEIKQQSPSGGMLRADFDAVEIARSYERCGAACLSILTEGPHFGGQLERLGQVREAVGLPLLQKDFLTDPYQVHEARYHGADAVLLIAAILDDARLRELADEARGLELDVLLEVHDEAELDRALALETPLLGINHRDLATYRIDLDTSRRLVTRMGSRRGERLVVAESGLRTADDVARVQSSGAHAVLIGETLMRRPDLEAAYAELFGAG